jgi:hypothetical protein
MKSAPSTDAVAFRSLPIATCECGMPIRRVFECDGKLIVVESLPIAAPRILSALDVEIIAWDWRMVYVAPVDKSLTPAEAGLRLRRHAHSVG